LPRDFLSTPGHAVFFVENAEALCCASALLGGKKAEARTRRLINEIGMAAPMSQRLLRELDALEDLLALRHVDDFDREEAEYFAMIDPASPVVEEICLLLDRLRDARKATAAFAA
jgi:glyoxylase-like metal-dependent hydrolase (beta-lactamase superfamily II)